NQKGFHNGRHDDIGRAGRRAGTPDDARARCDHRQIASVQSRRRRYEHPERPGIAGGNPGKHMLMGDDPRLPKMPEKPTLMDFFKYRFGPANHLLQSARHAVRAGMDEKVVLACLVHDIGVIGFIRADHGYWGAQMVAPYVDEEVSWAIRAHQALRFYADESVGYSYP